MGDFLKQISMTLNVLEAITLMKCVDCCAAGVYMAVRDEGSCTTLISLHVYYYVCPATVKSLTAFSRTPAGRYLTDVLPVGGACVSHAYLAGLTTPTYLCTSSGSWYLYTGGPCHCVTGYQPNADSTECVAGSNVCLTVSSCCSVTLSLSTLLTVQGLQSSAEILCQSSL